MIRGLYTSTWSMLANGKKMDVISNNLANVNTNAYKKETVIFESFDTVLTKRINDSKSNSNPTGEVGEMTLGSDVGEIFTYYNQGQLISTNSNLDLAFHDAGNAFFTVDVPDENGNSKTHYTRDGAFKINADGNLVTKDGYPVLGENGYIALKGDKFSIESDGTIVQDGQIVDKLLIKEFSDTTTLRKFGTDLVDTTERTEEQEFSGNVVQGSLEQSNVNIVKEMVDMITVMRSYEANQKLIQMQDNTLDKVVNEVGTVR